MDRCCKSEYVIAMFNNKNSGLTSRILCILDIFTQRARAPSFRLKRSRKSKHLGLQYPNYHSDFYQKCPFFYDCAPPPLEKSPYFLNCSPSPTKTLLWQCYYGYIDNKRASYTKLKLIKIKIGLSVHCSHCFCIIRFKYQFGSNVLPTKQLLP